MNPFETASTIPIAMQEMSEEKERSLAFFDYVMSHISEIALLVDHDGNVLYTNHGATRLLGYSFNELSRRKIWDFVPVLKQETWNRNWSRLASRNLLEFESDLLSRRGAGIPVAIKTSIVNYKGTDYLWALVRRRNECDVPSYGVRIRRRELLRILESIPDIVVRYDRNLRKTYVNRAWEKINNLSASAALGKTPGETGTYVTPMKVEQFKKMLKDIILTGDPGELDINQDSIVGPICYNLKAIPEYDHEGEVTGILTFARDVSAHKRELKQHHEREQMFRTLLENSPDTIVRYDLECRQIYVNRTFARLAGAPAEQLIGKRTSEISHSPGATAYEQALRETARIGREREIEFEWYGAGNFRIISHVRLVPEFDSDGRIASILGTGRDITQLRRVEAKVKHLAHYDSLTSLPNRVLIRKQGELLLKKAHLGGKPAAFFFIDLDNFKSINDTLGHVTGDEMLLRIASMIRNELQEGESLGRLGGDEFLLITHERANREDARLLALRIIKLFEQPALIDDLSLGISVSIGIATSPENGTDFETLLRKADAAMYKAKKNGRNTVVIYNETNEDREGSQLVVYSALKQALKRNEFTLHYQPQISLLDGSLCGAEALIRWNHPEKGLLKPRSFLPVAESYGLIAPIGEWVLQEACNSAVHWREKTGLEIPVAVNVSALQFRQGNLDRVIREILSVTKLPPSMLEIELTETAMLHNIDESIKTMNSIREMGVKVSLDDFGTGYSSLSYVARLPLDRLKIDASFISQLEQSDDVTATAIIHTIIQIAKTLKLETVAEGIENDNALRILRGLECNSAQGHLFSRALSGTSFLRFITGDQKFPFPD